METCKPASRGCVASFTVFILRLFIEQGAQIVLCLLLVLGQDFLLSFSLLMVWVALFHKSHRYGYIIEMGAAVWQLESILYCAGSGFVFYVLDKTEWLAFEVYTNFKTFGALNLRWFLRHVVTLRSYSYFTDKVSKQDEEEEEKEKAVKLSKPDAIRALGVAIHDPHNYGIRV